MFNWLFANKKESASVTRESAMKELGMRASIVDKLKNYNVEEDTTTSEFSLADDEKEIKTADKITAVTDYDVWGQANPKETGKWNKEVRQKRNRTQAGRHSINPREKNI